MKKIISLLSALLLLIIISCNKSPTETSTNLHAISGKIEDQGGTVSKATVSVDSSLNWSVMTASNGEFEIKNVSEGEHILYVSKVNDDDSFTELNEKISFFSDINLNSLLLPNPVLLNAPEEITMTSMKITWHKSDADNFHEYKLYRRTTP